ncbi:hypothetical protein FOZ60_013216 [Perkinsus olseni]|uniref:Uncharacterized protein n=1 Tax=Perkinsus olseni TaxID=32597 RepID=A0A7J6NAX5_PEROL|nr:hypothetical protein FOZ60_013216 [Perkinsus olseni]
MWSLTQDLSLRIDCINPEDVPATEILPLTKRRVFQHTGRLHETTREHGVTDYIKNALMMWAGVVGLPTDKKSWNKKLQVSRSQLERYKELLDTGLTYLRECKGHYSIEDRRQIVGFSDSSKEGCAFALFACHELHQGPDAIDMTGRITLQEGTYVFKEHKSEWNWHTNRKEFYGLVILCERILFWCDQLHPLHQQHYGPYQITIFTDSDVSRAWAQQGFGNKFLARLGKTDQNGVAKLVTQLDDIKHKLKTRGFSISFEHIHAQLNGVADFLSRLPEKMKMPEPIVTMVANDNAPVSETDDQMDLPLDDQLSNNWISDYVVRSIDDDLSEEDGDDSEAEGSILNEDESIHEGPIPIEKSELRLFLKLTEEQFREQLGPLQRESADILYKVPVKELFAYLDGETRGGSFIFSHYEDCEKLCSLHRRCGLDEQQRLVILVNHRDSLAKVYVPSGKARSYLFFKNHHHPLFAAHIGGQRCYENIKQKYFFGRIWLETFVALCKDVPLAKRVNVPLWPLRRVYVQFVWNRLNGFNGCRWISLHIEKSLIMCLIWFMVRSQP